MCVHVHVYVCMCIRVAEGTGSIRYETLAVLELPM